MPGSQVLDKMELAGVWMPGLRLQIVSSVSFGGVRKRIGFVGMPSL